MDTTTQRPTRSPSTRIPDNRILNVIRSIAALAVVLGHIRLLFFEDYSTAPHSTLNAALYSLTSLGSQAVIVFFALSGFWVGGSVVAKYRSKSFEWAGYGSARLTRLWLVLLPALVLTFVLDRVGHTLFPKSDVYSNSALYEGLPAHLSYSPVTFLGNVAFLQDLHVPVFGSNQPLWSLAFEFWYYLLFPALLALFWRGQSKRARGVGLVLAVAALGVGGPTVLVLFPVWAFGAAVAAFREPIAQFLRHIDPAILAALRVTTIAMTLGAAVFAHEVALPFSLGSIILGVVTAVMIATFVTDVNWSGTPGQILNAASWTAHSSYSLYATHMPVITLLAAIFVPIYSQRQTISPSSVMGYVGVLLLCCLVAYLFARFTERKTNTVRGWMSRLLKRTEPSN